LKNRLQRWLRQDNIPLTRWPLWRLSVQVGFTVLCIWLGMEFVQFLAKVNSGAPVDITERPPGVEGFLPISSLMELWLWLKAGIAPVIHPAGVIIIAFALGTALLIRRGFCSWLCPVGTLSEALWRIGQWLGINIKPWKWVDIPLRGIKFLLLGFFVYVIFGMSAEALLSFLQGDYNRVSDIKMLDFFIAPSKLSLYIIAILAVLSMPIKNFWCRYACPYGALLGLFARFSLMAIRRDAETCIDCDKCDKACPSYLNIATVDSIGSEECLACQQCTAVCPVPDCLTFSAPRKLLRLRPAMYGVVFVAVFLACVGAARLFGYWYTTTPVDDLRTLTEHMDSLGHPRDVGGYR